MSKGHQIRAIGQSEKRKAPSKSQNAQVETVLDDLDLVDELAEPAETDVLDLSEMDEEPVYFDDVVETPHALFGWIAPALAVVTVLAWSGLYCWAMQAELMNAANVPPSQWVNWIIDWSVPVLLVCVVWLLVMRNSRREANRFAATASLLSQESTQLESRLTVVNRELSLAREFLASQSRDLDSLGRVASERISEHAAALQDLIKNNDKQVQSIGKASDTALANMVQLRDDLPVIATSARDVSNQIGNAGRTAKEHLDTMVGEFEKLDKFGTNTEQTIGSINSRVSETIGGFDAEIARLEETVTSRFDLLQNKAAEYRNEMDQTEAEAFAALSGRFAGLQSETDTMIAKLRDAEKSAEAQQAAKIEDLRTNITLLFEEVDALERNAVESANARVQSMHSEAAKFDELLGARDLRFMEEMKNRQTEFEEREARGGEMLAKRLTDLDKAMAEQRTLHGKETEKLAAQSAALSDQFGEMGALIKQIGDQSDISRRSLSEGLGDLGKHLSDKRLALGKTAEALKEINNAALKVLDNIEIGVHHTREELPEAIKSAAAELNAVEEQAGRIKGVMLTTAQRGEDLGTYLTTAHTEIERTDTSIEELKERFSEHVDDALAKLNGLRGGLSQMTGESEQFAEETQETLKRAISSLEVATQSAFATLEAGANDKVEALADKISQQAVEQLTKSLRDESVAAMSQVEEVASNASGVGRDVMAQLRDQLAKVNELTGNLEQRISRARELAEEQVNHDFSRRMALITDSLNSSAIDIASSLSREVPDTEWNAYLKGDRGIFTRRAVRLVDNSQAKEIAHLYQSNEDFHANVNRYIHDFEAMLRSMLSTRDGNALGVTVLGSDMGKLYVALAQGIERLRT